VSIIIERVDYKLVLSRDEYVGKKRSGEKHVNPPASASQLSRFGAELTEKP
jgi:hypothetical protein